MISEVPSNPQLTLVSILFIKFDPLETRSGLAHDPLSLATKVSSK